MKQGLHRDNSGNIYYYYNNKFHRTDGPAVFHAKTGDYFYFLNGKLHRVDGPAAIYGNGKKDWYIDGEKYSKKEYFRIVKLYGLI